MAVIKARNSFLLPQKINGQRKFKNNWIKKVIIDDTFVLSVFVNIKIKKEINIKMYKIGQTILKIFAVGKNFGFINFL